MESIKCSECGEQVSDDVNICFDCADAAFKKRIEEYKSKGYGLIGSAENRVALITRISKKQLYIMCGLAALSNLLVLLNSGNMILGILVMIAYIVIFNGIFYAHNRVVILLTENNKIVEKGNVLKK